MAKRVLVPVDGSEQAWTALAHATAEYPEARLTLLSVIDPRRARTSAGRRRELRRGVIRGGRSACRGPVRIRTRAHGRRVRNRNRRRPAHGIVTFADEHPIDAIVMGSHGRDGVSRILLGSVRKSRTIFEPIGNP